MFKLNFKYFTGFVLVFLIEAFIAVYVRDNFIRPFLGDVLVVVLIYFFVRSVTARLHKRLPYYVFLFAAFVEFLQSLNIVRLLGLEGNKIASLVIGSTFDWADIACYAVGCLIIIFIDHRNAHKKEA